MAVATKRDFSISYGLQTDRTGTSTGDTLVVDQVNDKVGVNQGSPGYDLDVTGDLNFTGTLYQNGSQYYASRWTLTGSDIYRLSKVGINESNPQSQLAVNGYITESTDNGTTYWNVVTQQDIGTDANQVPLNQYLGKLAFLDDFSPNGLRREGGSSDDVVVDSSGNTGVGTNNPLDKLSIWGGTISLWNTSTSNRVWSVGTTGGHGLMKVFRSDTEVFLRVDSDGRKIGVGTDSPARMFHISSSGTEAQVLVTGTTPQIRFNQNATDGNDDDRAILGLATQAGHFFSTAQSQDTILRTTSTGNLLFGCGTGEKVRIANNGNVGIADINPDEKLVVAGNIRTTGSLYGPSNFIIDPSTVGDDTGTVEIKGNLVVQGTTTTVNSTTVDLDHLSLGDNEIANFGDSNDLQIYHDGSQSFILDNGSGNLNLRTNGTGIYFQSTSSENLASFEIDGAVKLYYDNVQKFQTTSGGVRIGSASAPIDINAYETLNNGTLSFEGSAGQLFSITNSLTSGSIFSVNDVSGIPSIDVDADGTITLAEFGGNVGIGTPNPIYKLEVVGSFAATTKSFVIPHPTKEGMKLRYGSIEGPENGVYVRGKTTEFVIELPDYWTGLVDEDTISVNLTPIGKSQTLWVKSIKDNKVYVGSKCTSVEYFYTIYGERKDVEKLEVEIGA